MAKSFLQFNQFSSALTS